MGHPGASKFKPGVSDPAVAKRWAEALQLRIAGLTYPQIAEKLGFSNASGAHHAVQAALMQTVREPSDELRGIENDRFDRMQAALWAKVIQGDEDAINTVLKICKQRAAINGLNAPIKVESNNTHRTPADDDARLAQLLGHFAHRFGTPPGVGGSLDAAEPGGTGHRGEPGAVANGHTPQGSG